MGAETRIDHYAALCNFFRLARRPPPCQISPPKSTHIYPIVIVQRERTKKSCLKALSTIRSVSNGVSDVQPFHNDSVYRPSVAVNLQNAALAQILQLLEGIPQTRTEARKKRKAAQHVEARKRRKVDNPETGDDISMVSAVDIGPGSVSDETPAITRHIVYGINDVTRRLEEQVDAARLPTVFTTATSTDSLPSPLEYIFVCRADVDPPLLINHIPHLVAAFNSVGTKRSIKLIPLPKGSETSLAKALGVRRAAVLALDVSVFKYYIALLMSFQFDFPSKDGLQAILKNVPIVTATWLTQRPSQLVPTHVKHVRTTAPVDMKKTKELRSIGRAEAKAKKADREPAQ